MKVGTAILPLNRPKHITLFGSQAIPLGPFALRPCIATGLPVRRSQFKCSIKNKPSYIKAKNVPLNQEDRDIIVLISHNFLTLYCKSLLNKFLFN